MARNPGCRSIVSPHDWMLRAAVIECPSLIQFRTRRKANIMTKPNERKAWKALEDHQKEMASVHVRDLFKSDPQRFDKFNLRFNDILLDFSKNRITDNTLKLLYDLARESDLAGMTEKMFTGQKINTTEDRAVLHVALRNRANRPIVVDGKDVMPEVNAVLKHEKEF